jgi:hypothetical protein
MVGFFFKIFSADNYGEQLSGSFTSSQKTSSPSGRLSSPARSSRIPMYRSRSRDPVSDPCHFPCQSFPQDLSSRIIRRTPLAFFSSSYCPSGSSRSSKRQQLDVFQRLKNPPDKQNNPSNAIVQNRCAVIRQKTRPSRNRPFKSGSVCQTGRF